MEEDDTLPLIKEKEERGNVTGPDSICGLSLVPADPALVLRQKTWMVPLSLETANHSASEEKAKL